MSHAPGSHISGWMSEAELEWLYEQADKARSIVEIGCWFGRSTYALWAGCKGVMYAVDSFQGHLNQDIQNWYKANAPSESISNPLETFMANMRTFFGSGLFVFPMDSACASHNPLIPATVDFVFIDGDHSYKGVSEDLRMWGRRAGKVLAGHDRDIPSVYDAVTAMYPATSVNQGPGSIWYVTAGVIA